MKRLKIFALILALVASVGMIDQLQAQDRKEIKKENQSLNYLSIPNLTDAQKAKIESLKSQHDKDIEVLRNKRRATSDQSKKNIIRDEMDAKIKANHEKIKKELSKEQQAFFDKNCVPKSNCMHKHGKRGSGKGYGNGLGKRNRK